MVHAVLRGSPSALAWSSSERNPTSIRTCPSSRILPDWRAFISAMTGRAGLVCADSVRFGGAAMFFSPERTLVAGTSTAENLLTTPTLRYCAQFRCRRATQCCSLSKEASSIELLNTAKAALSIELRANFQITEKGIGLEGLSPPMAFACDNLADDLGKSQPQSSILQTICNVNAGVCYFFRLPPARCSQGRCASRAACGQKCYVGNWSSAPASSVGVGGKSAWDLFCRTKFHTLAGSARGVRHEGTRFKNRQWLVVCRNVISLA